MIKSKELSDPNSCLNRAADNEMLFVVRAHDITFPGTVRDWVIRRLRAGKNTPNDAQIQEAAAAAERVEFERGFRDDIDDHHQWVEREMLRLLIENTQLKIELGTALQKLADDPISGALLETLVKQRC